MTFTGQPGHADSAPGNVTTGREGELGPWEKRVIAGAVADAIIADREVENQEHKRIVYAPFGRRKRNGRY